MNRQINHKVMRVIIGIIALLLAPAVYLLSDNQSDLTSISISYWTDSHDIFVGSLFATGFFLSAYNGSGNGRDLEFYLSKASGVFSVGIALFPAYGFSDSDIPAKWILNITDFFHVDSFEVHNVFAALFFLCLIIMMWLFSDRAMGKKKKGRSYFYRSVSISMAAGILLIVIIGRITDYSKTILIAEIWGLTLFGAGWLAAGSYRTE
jgi:hypothetical protein